MGLSGAEQLRSLLSGETPPPPLSRLTGMRLEEYGAGTAAFRMPLSAWLGGPAGTISLGALTIPADAAMACAVMTTLPPATPFTTSELSLRLLRPPAPGGSVLARARVIQAGPPVALADVELRDDDGELVAHGSSLCITLGPLEPGSVPGEPARTTHADPAGDPDPWERPVSGVSPAPTGWERLSGLQRLSARLSSRQPASPIELLTGLAPAAASAGQASFALSASPWFAAPPPGRVQGGVVALLADAALSGAAETVTPAGTSFTAIDLKLNYLRPLASDGREVQAHARLIHSGRRIAVAGAEVQGADGRAFAFATGSGLFSPAPGAPDAVAR